MHTSLGCTCSRQCRDRHARYERYRRHAAVSGRPYQVSALGAQRRIRALLVLGWRCEDIAAAGGWETRNTVRDLVAKRTVIRADTARRIIAAYDALSMRPGPSVQGRLRALRKGWAPPLAWDDETIDEPDATPGGELELDVESAWRDMQLGDLAAGRGLSRADRVELLRRWARAGRSWAALERAGWNPGRDLRLERAPQNRAA